MEERNECYFCNYYDECSRYVEYDSNTCRYHRKGGKNVQYGNKKMDK